VRPIPFAALLAALPLALAAQSLFSGYYYHLLTQGRASPAIAQRCDRRFLLLYREKTGGRWFHFRTNCLVLR